jgi:hypothetical protein
MVSSEPADYDPLAELSALGSALAEMDQEAGGSIRAKKAVDLGRTKRIKDDKNLQAKVLKVSQGAFPLVALVVKVSKAAKTGPGSKIKKNSTLTIIPQYTKSSDGSIDLKDSTTLLNAGAYFLQKGDKVVIRLGPEAGKVRSAEYLERK